MGFIKKQGNILLLSFSFFFFGCSSEKTLPPREINYVHFSNKVVNQFCLKMEKNYGLVCVGAGGGFAHDIQNIQLNFISYKVANKEEARKLEIVVIGNFLKEINENKEVRPYLREHPFTPDRAKISISFKDKRRELDQEGDLTSVFQVKNKIIYDYNDFSNKLKYRTEEESYEEALLKVQKENPGLNLRERQ